VGDGEVLRLAGELAGRPLDLPPWALLFLSRTLPSVGGGPADPAAWDRWFGELSSFTAGEGEARARARKAAALPPGLAALYAEVRRLRESGTATGERLLALREAAEQYRDDWLLRAEVDELLAPGAAVGTAPAQA
jgi:phenylalanine-4-hydroxylase